MEAKQIEVRCLVTSLLMVLSLEGVMRWALSFHPMVVLGVARFIEAILIILIAIVWGRGLSSIGLDRRRWLLGFKRGLMWSAGFALVSSGVFAALLLADINALQLLETRLPRKHADIALFFFVGGILAPVAEEIFFRGLVYGFLRRWGFPLALVLTTLFFVLLHPMNRGLPLTQMVGGLLFAVAYEVEGNLLVPITVHALGNLTIFTLSLLLQW